MNSMLVGSYVETEVRPLAAATARVAHEMPSGGFFRGLLVGLGIMIPTWAGAIWLGLWLLNSG